MLTGGLRAPGPCPEQSCARPAARVRPIDVTGRPKHAVRVLPPTSPDLALDETRPYFLWWMDATVGDLRAGLRAADLDERAYWMAALLREANTRDVWLYVTPDEIRALWPRLLRHLGRARPMWQFLLELPQQPWPPTEVVSA